MNKIYPSSISPMIGSTTNSFAESCLRYLGMNYLLPVELVKGVDIHPLYKAVGTLTEERMVARLTKAKAVFERELAVKYSMTPSWQISGRVDFLVHGDENYLIETKGTLSKSKLKAVIHDGIPDANHVGQLLTYMSIVEVPKALYSLTYWAFDHKIDRFEGTTREFWLAITEGLLYIDGTEYTEYSIPQFLEFYRAVMEATDKPTLPPKTLNTYACNNCWFKDVCAANPGSKSEFIEMYEKTGPYLGRSFKSPKL